MTDLQAEKTLKGDAKILAEAKRRFARCVQWEADARRRFVADLKFAEGDSDNGWQWPDGIRSARDAEDRPCLTINKARQHCLQVVNDAKQNKPGVTVRAVGDGAAFEASEVFEGIVRHIEYQSKASTAYDTATEFQVKGGIGWWRVVTDYSGADTFDQEIYVRRIKDPLSVYLDPDIQSADGHDAAFGFVIDSISKEEYDRLYPDGDVDPPDALGEESWCDDDHVRVAEYYRRTKKKDKLLAFTLEGQQQVMRASQLPKEIAKLVLADPEAKSRAVEDDDVEWFKIAGDKIVERRPWPGRHIPLVRVIGEETIIDGKLDRKGHVRAMKDAQRMYNYNASAAVEFVALQGKSPFMAPVEGIEGYETYYATANTVNHAYLPYKSLSETGDPIPRPERAAPPAASPAFERGMENAERQLMMASGQFQSQFGENENATSGKAINERQRQGDTATYHYIDNLATAIRHTGVILLDLIPKIYDTPRVIQILAEDGEQSTVHVDPDAKQAVQEQKHGDAVRRIFNPSVGKYEVEADVGPAYATKRQQAFDAIQQILERAPNLVSLIGDLLFKSADFPLSDEIAERLKNMVPPQAMGDGAPPAVQEMQGQMQQMQQQAGQMIRQLQHELQVAQRELEIERLRLKAKDQKYDVAGYDALTRRLAVIERHITTPKELAAMSHDLVKQAHAASLTPVVEASEQGLQETEQQEPDGQAHP